VTLSLQRYVRLAACLAALSTGSIVSAQTTGSSRGYQGLFGGSGVDPNTTHNVDATLSLLVGYDDNATGAELGQPDTLPTLLQSAFYSGPTGTLNYTFNGRKVQFGATGGSSARYYTEEKKFVPTGHFGAVGFSFDASARTRVFVNQSVSYAPSYAYALTPPAGDPFPGEAVGSDADPLGDDSLLVYDTQATVTRNMGARTSLVFEGNYRYSDFWSDSDSTKDLKSYRIGGRFSHSLTRSASLRLGYRYRKGQYRAAVDPTVGTGTRIAATDIHDIDAGIDYNKALSFSRKTTLTFSVGSSMVNAPTSAGSSNDVEFTYSVVGNVGLNHQMGRTWSARVAYDRGVSFAETFSEPVFSNAVRATLEGFITRRTEFTSSFGLAIGDVGVGSQASAFDTYMASARVRSAISRNWALFVEYAFYSQDMGEAPIVPDELPPVLDRHSVRGGLTLWIPIWRK
jgi:hypothetical protein